MLLQNLPTKLAATVGDLLKSIETRLLNDAPPGTPKPWIRKEAEKCLWLYLDQFEMDPAVSPHLSHLEAETLALKTKSAQKQDAKITKTTTAPFSEIFTVVTNNGFGIEEMGQFDTHAAAFGYAETLHPDLGVAIRLPSGEFEFL